MLYAKKLSQFFTAIYGPKEKEDGEVSVCGLLLIVLIRDG
jgi:hypothetical protein